MIPIEPTLHAPNKYKITERNGVHTLEINRCQVKVRLICKERTMGLTTGVIFLLSICYHKCLIH